MRKIIHRRDCRLGGTRRLGNLGEQIMFKSERAFKNNRFAGFERAPLALNGPLAREQDEAARTVSAVACRKLV